MKQLNKSLINSLVTYSLIALAGAAAGTASAGGTAVSGNMQISAQVIDKCTISTSALSFGDYDGQAANLSTILTATATLTTACAKSLSTGQFIGLNGGTTSTGTMTARKMRGTLSNGDLLNYSLNQPTANTPSSPCRAAGTGTNWDDGTLSKFTLPANTVGLSTRLYTVCGEVAAGQNIQADTYSDSVIATINF
jgi:spore coat protein U-like protein